jgi:recombination DNA repair RAD52 pathway protein
VQEKKKKEQEYEINYSEAIKQNLADILSRKQFSYDAEKDAVFGRYKKLYTEQGKRAMQDTMGNAALLTGGYGNSYGTYAGQQAYNRYMQELSDKALELEQNAYNRYRDEENSAYKRLNTLMGYYTDDRDFKYQKEQDRLAQENLIYDRNREALENDRDYELDRQKLNATLQNAVNKEQSAQSDRFDPEEAYKFIVKYNDKIYTDEEFAEVLYQLYGDKKGFFDWMKQLSVPGSVSGRTYLRVLYEIHPELKDV